MEDKKREEKNSVKKEKVCEIFKVEEDGEEKIIKTCGTEIIKENSPNQIKNENKILKNILIWLGVFILAFFILFFAIKDSNNFGYNGMKWDIVKEGEVLFYHTSFLITSEEKKINYNVFIRNDPRQLEKIPFEGELNLREKLVLENTDDFVCEGKGGIAMINMQQIFNTFGTEFIKDPEAGCDPDGRYMFLKISPGEETKLIQTGTTCYLLTVKDCEILEATEKMIMELFIKYKIMV